MLKILKTNALSLNIKSINYKFYFNYKVDYLDKILFIEIFVLFQ